MKYMKIVLSVIIVCFLWACNKEDNNSNSDGSLTLQAEDFESSSSTELKKNSTIILQPEGWATYTVDLPITGRYQVEVNMLGDQTSSMWIEDYHNNMDERTYDITGKIKNSSANELTSIMKYGSPMRAGKHEIKIHASGGKVEIDWVKFIPIKTHTNTPITHTQKMDGTEWNLVWSDEFEGAGLPDENKWAYNVGDWGWGNNEPQYYTDRRTENARVEDGNLIIEAVKNDQGNEWTSARLTTQGKQSFLYGKIEFRAKVPVGRGTWAAGWTLGDEYQDELSWPYCGEIDILETVGYEIDDETGNGINHASCHTRAYYFKQNNQISSTIEVENMNNEFHTYAIEWYPDVIYGLLDGKRYYTYDKNSNELEWPFSTPQNIILNLAVGGGWGGIEGIDEKWDSHQFIVDYVRVYELK